MLTLTVSPKSWPMHEPFAIARGVQTDQPTIMVTLTHSDGHRGRGEACGIPYADETPESMEAQLAAVASDLVHVTRRSELAALLPPGGARCAVDSALWDLEAKRTGVPAWQRAAVDRFEAVETCFTIGIRDIAEYEKKARELAKFSFLKVKVDEGNPMAAVEAVHRGAPAAKLVVDANQAWSVAELKAYAPRLSKLGVVLLEQPIAVGDEAGLDGYRCPVALAADELVGDRSDLEQARGRFDYINIKLDKTGGLTEALALADAAEKAGFGLMVGCMAGSSLSMAPGMILAQRCAFVDLDGPLLQSQDWPDGLVYSDGLVQPPAPAFWG